MPLVKLHARNVGSLEPRRGRRQDYWWDASDSAPSGFGVRVSAMGADGASVRTYVLAYRIHGRKRFLKLGRVGADGSGLATARDRAREELRRVNDGKDPQARRQELRQASTVAELVGQFIDAGDKDKGGTKAAKTTREYRVLLRAEVEVSDFGRLPIHEAKRPDARRFLEVIARRAPVQANRAYQLVRAAFAWAIREELAEVNPCDGLGRPRKERPRERVLSDAEVKVVWKALDSLPVVVASAVRMLLLLGTRRGETLRMRWEDVKLDASEWVIPGEFRKGGEPLTVPLSAQAKAILEELDQGDEGPVFAGERGAAIASNPGRIGAMLRAAVKKAAARRKGVKVEPFTLHDLRRTCATGCAELGAPPHVVALILGHQTMPGAGRVTGVYDRSRRLREVAPWLTAWGNHVSRVVEGTEAADVVPLKRA